MYTLGQAAAPGTTAESGVDQLAKVISAGTSGAATILSAVRGGQAAPAPAPEAAPPPAKSNMGMALLVGAALVGLAVFVATRAKKPAAMRRRRK